MTLIRFDHFSFDLATRELTRSGAPVTLRPKTAELLRELITHRNEVLSKRELVLTLWHTEHVTDQSVFQAVSELRAALAPLCAIKTFPNRGYQWVAPVTEVRPRRYGYGLAAALLAGLMISAGIALQATIDEALPATAASATSLPALVAFSEGAAALQRGDTREAITLLELSVAERAGFTDGQLLLAEALLLSGDAQAARQRAANVMHSLDPDGDAYSLIAAMDLRSRADQQLGEMTSALIWAAQAADQASTGGFECTASDLHDRLLTLVQDDAYTASVLQASPVFTSPFTQQLLQHALAQKQRAEADLDSTGLAQMNPLPKASGAAQQCDDLRRGPTGHTPTQPHGRSTDQPAA